MVGDAMRSPRSARIFVSHLVTVAWLLVALLALVAADLPVATVLHGQPTAGPGAVDCVSWWCPQLIVTNDSTVILSAQCKSNRRGKGPAQYWIQSHDAGKTWTRRALRPVDPHDTGQPVYSTQTGTLIQVGNSGAKPTAATPARSSSVQALIQSEHGRRSRDHPGPMDLAWIHELPQPERSQLAQCPSYVYRSTNDGTDWSQPELIIVNGSFGPHYTGASINHGIEIQRGPHAGRLALARHLDVPCLRAPSEDAGYDRDFILFSDDNGAHWTAGQLLPVGFTETQVAEMHNGSLLLTSRLAGRPWFTDPYVKSNPANRFRAFARSDDGGMTWAEWWTLPGRAGMHEIGVLEDFLNEALTSTANGTIYWGHPQNTSRTRSNYTLHKSQDGGGSWEAVNRVYPLGAGYSDAIVVPDPLAPSGETLLMAFQKTFEPPVPTIEGGGYDVGLARLPL